MITILIVAALFVRPLPITPGVTRSVVTNVCTTRWGYDHRHVTEAMKRQIAAAYHIDRITIVPYKKGPCCEFDHLIPRELGGADDVKNVWPQPWADAKIKDADENAFHKAVCAGKMTLEQARQAILYRWGPR